MSNPRKILFLNLYAFSLTGGVEKVSRNFYEALLQLFGKNSRTHSMYDNKTDAPQQNYLAFKGGKVMFILQSVWAALNSQIVILSHINLLLVAKLTRLLAPNKRIILFAHGIEVWKELAPWKVNFLKQNVEIWAVSNFTKQKITMLHSVPTQQIKVLNNSLPQDVVLASAFEKPQSLLVKYQLDRSKPIIYTLNRLSSTERYKGYDNVIKAIAQLKQEGILVQYLLAGKADEAEYGRIKKLIETLHLEKEVKLIGFVPNNQLTPHFLLCDVFIMPSTGEGFGVVFIEAAAQGCQIIGGNVDGSTDALLKGKLGQLINPQSEEEMIAAIKNSINNTAFNAQQQQTLCIEHFGFDNYLKQVEALLT